MHSVHNYLCNEFEFWWQIMPLSGFFVSKLLRLPSHYAAGLILVGCCPGGMCVCVCVFWYQPDVPLLSASLFLQGRRVTLLHTLHGMWAAFTWLNSFDEKCWQLVCMTVEMLPSLCWWLLQVPSLLWLVVTLDFVDSFEGLSLMASLFS